MANRNPQEIAAGLSEDAVVALKQMVGPHAFVHDSAAEYDNAWKMSRGLGRSQMDELVKLGLVVVNGWVQATLTPLGREVAAVLEKETR